MCGAFGLHEDYWHVRVPRDRLVGSGPRVDVRQVTRLGGMVDGARLAFAMDHPIGGPPANRAVKIEFCRPNLLVNGAPILVTWDEMPSGGARPWLECPICSRRCRYLYLRERIACRQCEGLDWPSRHLHRGTPEIHRIRRLRERIGAKLAPFSPLPEPPPRRRVWFRRIAVRIAIEEATLLGHLAGINRDLARRARVRGWNRPVRDAVVGTGEGTGGRTPEKPA